MQRQSTQPKANAGNLKTLAHDSTSPAPFGTKQDVARMLQMSTRTVDSYLAAGLPHLKLGTRRVRFDLATVKAWVLEKYGDSPKETTANL